MALCAAILATSACAHGTARSSDATPVDDSDLVTLHVANSYKLNVVIYNVHRGSRDRLGEVTAVSSADFRLHLRRLVANEMQLYADPIGASRGVTSETVRLTPGDRVDWTIEYDLSRSHIEVH